jgi:hypothetical protein
VLKIDGSSLFGLHILIPKMPKTKPPKPNAPKIIPVTNPFLSGIHSHPQIKGGK